MPKTLPLPVNGPSLYAYRFGDPSSVNTPLYLIGQPVVGGITRTDAWHDAREQGQMGFAPRWFGPFTTKEGVSVMVRPAACGSGCFCAAEWKPAQATKATAQIAAMVKGTLDPAALVVEAPQVIRATVR